MVLTASSTSGGTSIAAFHAVLRDRVEGALADLAAVEIDARHPGDGGKGDKRGGVGGKLAATQVVFLLRQHDDRAALGSFIRKRGELSGVGQILVRDAGRGNEFRGAAVAERDRAGLIEQQRVHVARRLHGAARHRQHVALDDAVHARDSDGGEQTADRRGNQADQQRDQHEDRLRRAGINRHGLKRDHGQQEDDRQPGEQDIERDFVRRLLPLGAFDQLDHAIEKGLAGIRRDAHDDFVREHARAAGDRRAVAARFANHRSGLAGDGGFVDRGNAFDHFAVTGNEFSGDDSHAVTGAQLRACNLFDRAIRADACARWFPRGPCAACPPEPCRGLRPSPRQNWRKAP